MNPEDKHLLTHVNPDLANVAGATARFLIRHSASLDGKMQQNNLCGAIDEIVQALQAIKKADIQIRNSMKLLEHPDVMEQNKVSFIGKNLPSMDEIDKRTKANIVAMCLTGISACMEEPMDAMEIMYMVGPQLEKALVKIHAAGGITEANQIEVVSEPDGPESFNLKFYHLTKKGAEEVESKTIDLWEALNQVSDHPQESRLDIKKSFDEEKERKDQKDA